MKEKKEKEPRDEKKFVVKYNGFDIWTIDMRDEGVIKILPTQEIELDPTNKKQLHVILSVIKEHNQAGNEFSVVEKTSDGDKKVRYRKRFEVISRGLIPEELMELKYGINKLYTPEQKQQITDLCKEYFEEEKNRWY